MDLQLRRPLDADSENLLSEITEAVNEIGVAIIDGEGDELFEALYRCTFYPEILLTKTLLESLEMRAADQAEIAESNLYDESARKHALVELSECNRVITLCKELQANYEISEMTMPVYIKFLRDWMEQDMNLYQIVEKMKTANQL